MTATVRINLILDDTGATMGSFDVRKGIYQGLVSPDVFSIRMSRKTALVILRNIAG